jgi:putative spermidine/putrescine transport system permease protein
MTALADAGRPAAAPRRPPLRIGRLLLLAPAGCLLGVFLAGPMAYLLPYGLLVNRGMRTSFAGGFTLANYTIVLGDGFYLAILARTVAMGLAVTVCSIATGWPLAYFLSRVGPRWKSLLILGVVAPLLISIPVRNYGWIVILGDNGVLNGILRWLGLIGEPIQLMFTHAAVVIGLTHVLMPFVVLSVLAALDRIGPDLSEAAETLGAGRLAVIRHVLLPLTLPGIAAGATLVFCVAVSAYVTPALMGPSGARYAPVIVYQQFISAFNWPRGTAIASVLLVITALAVTAFLALLNRRHAHLMRAGD